MEPSTIAIVGMAGRFPGARNIREFWKNLHDGVESIRDLTDAELRTAGATPEELASEDYVKRASVLDDVPLFDASFFGLSPRDASIMDPQHRHFLECAWEALEDAGHMPQGFGGAIGVFAGSGMSNYLIHNLLANRKLLESAGLFQLKQTGNDKDVLATRVSYQLDLRGPSINVQTACSTSLVAIHLACQSLLNFECDMALAGGVTIEIPHGLGYLYREGEILSRDGHCRSFDASSSGTVFGSGLGIVVLRRLEDALADRDNICAVILGSAINNDGARKVGYLAPSVEGQAEVIAEALEFAGVGADEISYVEAHGTGTVVGDPIEIRALTAAFRKSATRSANCGIGSLKTNVGHLDAAAGVAGLMKTVLALEHAQLPASLHFQNLNPHIELKDSPFFVNSKLTDWAANGKPRRAGVTALGIGGTNAHVVLEEAPPLPDERRNPKLWQLLTVSAKTEAAADRALTNLADYLHAHPELNLADVAFTCQLGRHAFPHRRALAVENTREAISGLAQVERKQISSGVASATAPPVAFSFSGQGSQYAGMGRELYEKEPVFRETMDLCARHLLEPLGIDLRQALYPPQEEMEAAAEKLNQTWLTQPALFSIEYALARWWISLGVEPAAMVGHSIGEYVAACLAGVFSLEDALAIVAARGRLIYDLPAGSMLAVPLAADEIKLSGALSLAAVNNPAMCVVSGSTPEIAALEEELAKQSIASRRLFTSHAFHSAMMDPIMGEFEKRLKDIALNPPRIPYLSNVSGSWIKAEEATDPAYWARHIRSTVRFSDCLAELLRTPERIFVEVGPGNALTTFVRQQGGGKAKAFQSIPHPREKVSSLAYALQTLGKLWVSGASIDWAKLHSPDSPRRVSLPTYPFEHQRFWIEADKVQPVAMPASEPQSERGADEWFYRRAWKLAPITPSSLNESGNWMIFSDSIGLGDKIAAQLRANKQNVIEVVAGSSYKPVKRGSYTVRPGVREDYDALIGDCFKTGDAPWKILHLWSVVKEGAKVALEETLERSFYSPLFLAQALADQDIADAEIALVSNSMQQVTEEPVRDPARAVLLGPARVIPIELPGITCRSIDVDLKNSKAAEQIVVEMASIRENATVAYRNGERFIEALEPFELSATPENSRLERGGVYLLTGGLGGIGLVVAEHLAREFKARLVLVSRSTLPDEAQWETSLDDAGQAEAVKQTIRKLIEIRSLAGGLMVARGDVTNLEQMRGIVSEARRRYGKIDGVFHAAGVLDDGPLMLKSAASAARVLDPKVRGTLVLEEALSEEPLKCFVLFSSISSILPPAGQVDYAAANAFLDAFALSRKGPVTVINWGIWREVGMGARSASPHLWLEQRLLETRDEVVYSTQFSLERQWLISEHRLIGGKAIIPGTGHIEMAAGAFMRGKQGAFELRDVSFLAPLMFDEKETREVRVQLQREQEAGVEKGAFRFSLFARAGEWVEHSAGIIAPCHTRPAAKVDRAAIAARCIEREYLFDEQHRTRQERQLNFGPRWRSLMRLNVSKQEGLAYIELDERFSADVRSLRVHPALLDMATGAALYLTADYEHSNDLFLPISYKKISVYRTIPARFYSHIRSRQANPVRNEIETFDITLFDERDQVLAEIEGFAMRRIVNFKKALEENQLGRFASRSSTEQPIAIVERPGIPPIEGARALTRILLAATPTAVVAVAQPPEELDTRNRVQTTRATAVGASTASPAPGEGIEDTLALWWRELLGVEQVDPDDDFFALGGHSLVGVRMFAKIRKKWQVDLELAVLFEARTVRQLAALIRKAQPEPAKAQGGSAAPAAAPQAQKTWSSLVAVQPKGSKPPFFCVHANSGDVLFYEQLGRALAPDQPLYAFQSPLVAQPERTDITFEDMAALYIREMRAFYPSGPYLLGSASFGGFILYEMARQLEEQGITPGVVLILDLAIPGSGEFLDTGAKLKAFWGNIRRDGWRYLRKKAREKSAYFWERFLNGAVYPPLLRGYLAAKLPLPNALRYHYHSKAHWRAFAAYTFKPFPGKVTLIRASDRGFEVLGHREDPTLGWGSLALGGVEIIDLPTGHFDMLFEPYVHIFAQKLREILAGGTAIDEAREVKAQRMPAELVPVQPNGSKVPLFCVHAVGGDVLFYEQLARALGPDQPFYAFKSPLISRPEMREISMEELAATYIKEMRAFYPQGPYLLGGASYGGLVAYEMAQQLHAQGLGPELLVMFDTAITGHEQRVEPKDRAITFWRNFRKDGMPYLMRKATVKRKYWWEKLERRAQVAAGAGYRLVGKPLPLSLHYIEVEEAHWRALRRYTFLPYAGKVTLMRAVDRGPEVLGKREDPTLGWGPLANVLEIHDVPTGHMSMLFAPNVDTFAEMLKAVLP